MKRRVFGKMAVVMLTSLVLQGCASTGTNTDVKKEETTAAAQVQQTVAAREINLTQTDEYPESYLSEINATIQTTQSKITNESVSYIFITDIHLDAADDTYEPAFHQLNALVDIANNTDIDFVCIGGDYYDGMYAGEQGGKAEAMRIVESVTEVLEKCNKPVFMLKGNHDDNSFSAQRDDSILYDSDYIISNEEWYSITMGHFPQYAMDYHNGYFYYDIPGKNTRVICLNMSDSDDSVVDGKRAEMGMYFYGYKDEQIDWLLNTAMSRDDCQYLIMCHDAFDYPQGYTDGSNRDELKAIMKAAYTHTDYSGAKFSKNFSQWSGNITLYHSGHLHMTRRIREASVGNLPILNTEFSRFMESRTIYSGFGELGYSITPQRTLGTPSEAIFDVVISTGDEIDIVRFGAGEDDVLLTK